MTSATTGSNGTTATDYTLYDDVENNNNNNNNNIVIQVPTHPQNDTTSTTASSTIRIPTSLQQRTSSIDSSTDEITTTEGKRTCIQCLQNLQQRLYVCFLDDRFLLIYLNFLSTSVAISYLCAYIQDDEEMYEQLVNDDLINNFIVFKLLIMYDNVLYDWFIITIFVLYIGILVFGGIYGIAYNSKYLVVMCSVLYCIETIISAVSLQVVGTIVNAALAYLQYDIHTDNYLRAMSYTVVLFKCLGII